jgi:hypothetical protein
MALPAGRLALVLHQAVARSVSGLSDCRLLLRLVDVGVVQPDTCTVALLVLSKRCCKPCTASPLDRCGEHTATYLTLTRYDCAQSRRDCCVNK